MAKAHSPDDLARNVFWIVMAGITLQLLVILAINL